ncbi:hypothetical protein [Alkalibacillus haloalkaliphilus]|uniref:hypothetical protein n=1 Tax=Alkalibacillus haloalkaliphilus TaxID=94136 RepID=UPI0012FE1CF9|nr:hypothetical protein [Alkalibacillus haloalkaliphilus]
MGALIAFGSSLLLKTISYLFDPNVYVESTLSVINSLTLIGAMFLYILLMATLGYVLALLMNIHPIMKVIIPVTIIGLAISEPIHEIFTHTFQFYALEASMLMLLVKVLFTVLFLFGATVLLSDRWEVRS